MAITPAVVAVAVRVEIDAGGAVSAARIALGAAGPRPQRAHAAEAALLGRPLDAASIADAAQAAIDASDPLTDALASSWVSPQDGWGVYAQSAREPGAGRER